MANVVEPGLAGVSLDVVQHSGQVEVADLVPAEPPEVLVAVGVEAAMAARVEVAAGVAHPDVVAFIGEQVRWKEDKQLFKQICLKQN